MITKKLSSREKNIFILCIATVLVYAGYHGIFLPIKGQKESLENKINATERKLKKNKRIIQNGKALKKEYDQILAKFRQGTSDEQVMSSILSEIEKVASESNMRIAEMKPQRVKKVDFYNHFSVSLSTDGSLNDILNFLHMLQDETHFFDIDDLRFDKISPRTPNLKCRLIISKVLIP